MSNIEDLLNTFLPHDEKKAWYRAPNIPPKKQNNALSRYASLEEDENILALGDGTVFGSAKTGVLITDKQLHCNTSEGTFKLPWNEVGVRVWDGEKEPGVTQVILHKDEIQAKAVVCGNIISSMKPQWVIT